MFRTRPLRTSVVFAILVGVVLGSLPMRPIAAQGFGEAEKLGTQTAPPNNKLFDKLIYVPFRQLTDALNNPDSTAIVSLSQYLRLLEQANKNRPDRPPVGAAITAASYTATIERDLARIQVTLTVQAIEKGWSSASVKFGEAAVGQMSSDSGDVLLVGIGNGQYSLLFPRAGQHTVQLELLAKVRNSPEGRSFELDVPPVAINSLEMVVAEADQTIEVTPKLVPEEVPQARGETRIKVRLGVTEKIAARWHPRVGTRPDMELLATASTLNSIQIGDGLVHVHTSVKYDVLRGQVDKLRLLVPGESRILDVTASSKLRDWGVVKEGETQIVTVTLLERSDRPVTLDVHTEQTLAARGVEFGTSENLPKLRVQPLDVIRESGFVSLAGSSDLTMTIAEQAGLNRVDEASTPAEVRQAGAMYFRYFSGAFRLVVEPRPISPRLLVNQQSILSFDDEHLRLRSTFGVVVERAGVFELTFQLPANMKLEQVYCDGMKQFDVDEASQTLKVTMVEKLLGARSLTIIGQFDKPALAPEKLTLPVVQPLAVEVENGQLLVLATDGLEISTDLAAVTNAQPELQPIAISEPSMRLVSAWKFSKHPVSIPVAISRRPTRLTGEVATRIDYQQSSIGVESRVTALVEYAGLDTFRLQVPADVADRVQISLAPDCGAPAIQQKTKGETANGWTTFDVSLQREYVGRVQLLVTYDWPSPLDPTKQAEPVSLKIVRLLASPAKADRSQSITVSNLVGEISITKDRSLAVEAVGEGADVEAVDVRELKSAASGAIAGFRYFQQPASVVVTAVKFDVQGMVSTVVSRALVEVVLDRAGTATYRCRYRLKTAERQRIRIDLPNRMESLGVLVDQKPVALEKKVGVQAEKGWDAYSINVSRPTSADEAFSITVLFRDPLSPPAFENRGGKALLRLPQLGGNETGKAAIQQIRAAVWVPESFSLVGSPEGFRPERPTMPLTLIFGRGSRVVDTADLERWITTDVSGVFDFPRDGSGYVYTALGAQSALEVTWWHLPFYTWIVSGSLLVAAFLLRRTTWENKLTILLLVGVGLAFVGLNDRDLAVHAWGVAAYGLTAMLLLWTLATCCGPAAAKRSESAPPTVPPTDPAPMMGPSPVAS